MKYIRTNYTIASIERNDEIEIIKRTGQKVADTIEELCDEFVYKYVNPYHRNDKPSYELVNMTLKNMKLTMEMTSGATFYGAIWTDKGLIFVAKMNEKGELELL